MSAGTRRFALAGYESRRRLKGSLAVSVGLSLLAVMMVAFFPSVKASGADLQAYIESLPPAFQAAFGVEVEAFTTMGGFLATELYQFAWVLLLGLYFAYRAGSLVAGDVERGRMDTLLSTPLSRSSVVVEKFASLLIPIVVVNAVTFVVVYGSVLAVGETIDVTDLVMVHLLSVPYLLATAAIGLLLSVVTQRTDLAQRGALGVIFALFIVETVAASVDGLSTFALVSPTHYYDPTAILVHSEYDPASAGILLGTALVLVAVSVLWFRRADVR